MSTGPQKILCPIEFDDSFMPSVELAKTLVKRNNGIIYLMHIVAPPVDPLVVSSPARAYNDLMQAEEAMKELIGRSLTDVTRQVILRTGDPAEEIIKAEKEFDIDLVIMPTHKHSKMFRLLSEGVSRQVIDDSWCPVTTLSERAWGRSI